MTDYEYSIQKRGGVNNCNSVSNAVYFGEITFYPGCGLESFKPERFDRLWGDCIDLTNT
ncbi:MAG: hypothetical protein HDS18_04265 [Bacteroides sp.]|nr:hypothetical protein [Bacteroides sp.]